MTRYEEVCADNKILYAELEILTTQINACKETNSEYDVEYLKSQKSELVVLININLDEIQHIWDVEKLVYDRPNKLSRSYTPTRLEVKIIESYQLQPSQTIESLGIKHNVKTSAASTVITKLLNKQYIGY